MKRYILLLAAALLFTMPSMAQRKSSKSPLNAAPTGGISTEMMQQIKKSYSGTATDKAIRNVLVTNSPAKLALNYENATAFDSHFSNKVESKAITDQKSSGRCWMFTGMNVLRNKAIRQHNLPSDFQFSQAYTFFYDQLEKANLFLQAVIDTYRFWFDYASIS